MGLDCTPTPALLNPFPWGLSHAASRQGQWLLPSSCPSSVTGNPPEAELWFTSSRDPLGTRRSGGFLDRPFSSRSSLQLQRCCCPASPYGAEAAPCTTWGFLFPLQAGRTAQAHMWYGAKTDTSLGNSFWEVFRNMKKLKDITPQQNKLNTAIYKLILEFFRSLLAVFKEITQ